MSQPHAKSAVVLLSGGLDSATALAIAASQGYTCHALSFDYGQRHAREIQAAATLARHFAVSRHVTMNIDLRAFGGSALTADIPVPKDQFSVSSFPFPDKTVESSPSSGHAPSSPLPTAPSGNGKLETGNSPPIPITYVPARNTVFLSLALAWAETLSAFDIFIGVNAVDYSGYPDCRPEFIHAFETLANLATRDGVQHAGSYRIHTPLIALSKADIIRTGLSLHVPYHLTHSCYDPTPEGKSCGHCDSCLLRLQGFQQAGAVDPIAYAS
jgi:7-cyano-7-deazaguanine synthase